MFSFLNKVNFGGWHCSQIREVWNKHVDLVYQPCMVDYYWGFVMSSPGRVWYKGLSMYKLRSGSFHTEASKLSFALPKQMGAKEDAKQFLVLSVSWKNWYMLGEILLKGVRNIHVICLNILSLRFLLSLVAFFKKILSITMLKPFLAAANFVS